jgi:hypothetical protein
MHKSNILKILIAVSIVVSMSQISIAADTIRGFRELPFGINIDGALKIYPDLSITEDDYLYGKFYRRSNESLIIGDINFKEIKYAFENDIFVGVSATIFGSSPSMFDGVGKMSKKIEETVGSYNRLKGWIESKYGSPSLATSGIEGTRLAEWLVGDVKIALNELPMVEGRVLAFSITSIKAPSNLGF